MHLIDHGVIIALLKAILRKFLEFESLLTSAGIRFRSAVSKLTDRLKGLYRSRAGPDGQR